MSYSADCRRWLWLELIGFDNTSEDFGVGEYLEAAAFVPEAVSFLFFSPDFVHLHDGLQTERILPPDQCSYAGRPFGLKRRRQAWTNLQLKGLVDELHRNGALVYCSFFNVFTCTVDGAQYTSPWSGAHPELWETGRRGEATSGLLPLHRFADGSDYADFFIPRLCETLADYGFDGYHGADGYSSLRRSLFHVDYSDDMVDQFLSATAIELPSPISRHCDGHPDALEARADWIWRTLRPQWAQFYATRWAGFWRKVAAAVHAQGKQVVVNNAWARDPFQAVYRYGIDYAQIADAGVDGFVVETVAPGVSIGAEWGIEADTRYDLLSMLLLMKAYCPNTPLLCLSPTFDVTEQWDTIHHAPTVTERDIYSVASLRLRDGASSMRPCSDGPMACLASDLQPEDWGWLVPRWERAFSLQAARPLGATVLWSDRALAAGLDAFPHTRDWSAHKLVYELMAAGAALHAAARVEHIGELGGALVVANPHLWPQDELATLWAYSGGPLVMIGPDMSRMPQPDLSFADNGADRPLACLVYGHTQAPPQIALEPRAVEPEDLLGIEEPWAYMFEPPFRQVSNGFVAACADVISRCSGAIQVLTRPDAVRVWALESADGTLRAYVVNDSYFYVISELDCARPIQRIAPVTQFPNWPVIPQGSRFTLKLPPRGIVVVDLIS